MSDACENPIIKMSWRNQMFAPSLEPDTLKPIWIYAWGVGSRTGMTTRRCGSIKSKLLAECIAHQTRPLWLLRFTGLQRFSRHLGTPGFSLRWPDSKIFQDSWILRFTSLFPLCTALLLGFAKALTALVVTIKDLFVPASTFFTRKSSEWCSFCWSDYPSVII